MIVPTRRILTLVGLAGLLLSSCSATLTMRATAPTLDNDGTCASPVLFPSPSGVVRIVHFAYSGPASGEDSVATVVGGIASLTVNVPPGVYSIRGWASGFGGVGCDTTINKTVTAPPWRVSFQ